MLEFTADTNARFTRVDSDYNMATNGDLAIANEEIKSGDRAGYYQVIVPRDGDIFEYDLDTASALVHGTALYWSADETLTATTGTAIIGYSVGQGHYPLFQGHLSEDNGPDRGETVRSTSVVHVMFRWTNSYLYRFQKS